MFLILTSWKGIPFLLLPRPRLWSNDATRIHHVYKPDFSSLRFVWPRPEVGMCLPLNRRPCSVLFSLSQWCDQIIMRQTYTLFIWIYFFSLVSNILYSFFYLSLYEFLAFFLQPLKRHQKHQATNKIFLDSVIISKT